MDVWNAERDVIHDAQQLLVSVGGHVEHELDPVGAVGYLQVEPVGLVVVHPAVPIRMKSKDVSIEMVFRSRVFDDEASVDQTFAYLGFAVSESVIFHVFDETYLVPFRIGKPESRGFSVPRICHLAGAKIPHFYIFTKS